MLGLISIVLTIMNIVCIWLVAWLTYRFFNVGTVQSNQQFYDLIQMRKVMKRVKENQHAMRGEQLRDLLQQLNQKVGVSNNHTLTFRMDTLLRGATLRGTSSKRGSHRNKKRENDRQLPSQWINMYNEDSNSTRGTTPPLNTPRLFKMRSMRAGSSPSSTRGGGGSGGVTALNIAIGE